MSAPHALIIDDSKTNIEVLTMMLSRQGVEFTAVQFVQHLEAVLETIEKLDVVFLDLELPNYDGFEILASLKQKPQFAGVPIVAYTVHNSEIDIARKAGFHSFLGKPLSLAKFPDQLQRILAGIPVWEV
ncbi:MAG: response regulator [Anaerolineae bacterium]|nr:response regulator [Anaerolineae bacterium]